MKKKARVYMRSKGSLAYGWGHIIRSMTVARHLALSKGVAEVKAVIEGDDAVKRFVKKSRIANVFIDKEISLKQEKLQLKAFSPDIIITDMLKVPDKLLSAYGACCRKLAIFNDMGYEYKTGNVLINPQILPSYPRKNAGQKHLNGTDYFVLSEDILKTVRSAARKNMPVAPKNLVIIMGGCVNEDIFKRCSQVIDGLDGTDMNIKFILGYDNNIDKNKRRALEERGVSMIEGTNSIGKLMASADMAFASSGYVKYELAALGVPAVLVSVVDHQEDLARPFVAAGSSAEYAGKLASESPAKLAQTIIALAGDRPRRQAMADSGRRLVDGMALERIESELVLC